MMPQEPLRVGDKHASRLRRAAGRVVAGVRDAWLIIGITLLFCVAIELLYRAQGAARRSLREDTGAAPRWTAPNHPNAGEMWWQEMIAGDSPFGGGTLRYDPFRGWWPSEYHSRHVNVDGMGRRITIQPLDSATRRRVYMFGGSVMWGWMSRDSGSIPALVAARLRSMGHRNVEVVNMAQSSFDLAQNGATLIQHLRQSEAPVVAVFLDGNNEVAPVFQSGRVGSILNQALIARRFERRTDAVSDFLALLQHSDLVQRLRSRPPPTPEGDRTRLCGAVAMSYARQVEMLTAIASRFGFRAVFFWQPMLATTEKPLTPWERSVRSGDDWGRMVRRCSASVDSAMALRRGLPFHALHSLFDAQRESIFLDDYGHLTERGNALVAERIARVVADGLEPP